MVVQYTKFLKMGLESKWRGPVAALTYIETSTWTRQGESGWWRRKKALHERMLTTPLAYRAQRFLSPGARLRLDCPLASVEPRPRLLPGRRQPECQRHCALPPQQELFVFALLQG